MKLTESIIKSLREEESLTGKYEWYLDQETYNELLDLFHRAVNSDNTDYIKEQLDMIYKTLVEKITDAPIEYVDINDTFVNMVWDRISEYADPEEYFLDKLTDEDVNNIAKDIKDIWNNGNFEQSDLDEILEKYAYQKYGKGE